MTARIGFDEALHLTMAHISALAPVEVSIEKALNRVLAQDLVAAVDAPSADVSLKDGYAIRSSNIESEASERSVSLKLKGLAGAGDGVRLELPGGCAARILTGARLPIGADTVVAEEFVTVTEHHVAIPTDSVQGMNVLPRGTDVSAGTRVLRAGVLLTPGRIGLLAAAGLHRIAAIRIPRVSLVATGNEIRMPGSPLDSGQLYASNLFTLDAWCRQRGMSSTLNIVGDHRTELRGAVEESVATHDAVITSGGAWTGDRDWMARVMDELGWEKIYHRVRLGPGKAAGFGILQGKPVFLLPGGPPSNLVAFLLLALPGLMKLAGHPSPGLVKVPAILSCPVAGHSGWTQAIFGHFDPTGNSAEFRPLEGASRLIKLAEANGLLLIPEERTRIANGESITVQRLA
ncbi:Molybdopterin molybdenumtransferase (EC [Olavius algarvensis associated proteobacterium Delta 3]|nr:Molybdopterin molybdenumtransferase (EC [Olavius algarvensis associated proteobacterium Delta 3]